MLPKLIVGRDLALLRNLALAGELEVHDRLLARLDHAGRDLRQETRHLLVRVVVASDGVDQLDPLKNKKKNVNDGGWSAGVKLKVWEKLNTMEN